MILSKKPSGLLSKEDVERLLNDKTFDARINVIDKITNESSQARYSLDELAVAEQILRIMVKDTENTVRKSLALKLKDNKNIAEDIIVSLSRDEDDEVAMPIIKKSPLLSDYELISLIKTSQNIKKQEAIAERAPLSNVVCEALIETNKNSVVSTLTKNYDADIKQEQYQQIINKFDKDKEIMRAISERPNLPITIAEKVIKLVTDTIEENIKEKQGAAHSNISLESEKTREVATLKLIAGEENKNDVEKLVDQLLTFGRLTPSIILTALCRGNLHFFETSLARLSGIPIKNAQTLIHDKGGLGFKALYNKASLPEKFFVACEFLLETVSEMKSSSNKSGTASYSNSLVQKLLEKSAGKNIENLSYIIALIRQVA
ncbi:MAG: DUF2336 domain-containing protein [Pseudomonadota bacterium]